MAKKDSMWLDRALFVTPFYYRLCLTEKDFHDTLYKMKLDPRVWPPFVSDWHTNATVHVFEDKIENQVIATVNLSGYETRSGVEIAGILVHEAVHLWQETKKYYGEHEPSAEVEAYAIQTISQRLMESFAEQTKGVFI